VRHNSEADTPTGSRRPKQWLGLSVAKQFEVTISHGGYTILVVNVDYSPESLTDTTAPNHAANRCQMLFGFLPPKM